MSTAKKISATLSAITPYLTVQGAEAAMDFYKNIFGAKEVGRLIMQPGNKIGHAELAFGNTVLYVAEENPTWGNKSPTTVGGSPVTIALRVNDVDATFQRAVDAGATVLEPVKDQFYGERAGALIDPFGHRWHVSTHIEDVSFAEMQRRCDAMMAAHSS
ncbi:MAG: VOC family protein [Gallionellaceae bacterium]|nr:MAG: VOC family protein [Gallionellaceae bacterium]